MKGRASCPNYLRILIQGQAACSYRWSWGVAPGCSCWSGICGNPARRCCAAVGSKQPVPVSFLHWQQITPDGRYVEKAHAVFNVVFCIHPSMESREVGCTSSIRWRPIGSKRQSLAKYGLCRTARRFRRQRSLDAAALARHGIVRSVLVVFQAACGRRTRSGMIHGRFGTSKAGPSNLMRAGTRILGHALHVGFFDSRPFSSVISVPLWFKPIVFRRITRNY